MIKRIIFDLDDTLIIWKKDYIKALEDTLKLFNIDEDADYINSLIDEYDDKFDHYDVGLLISYINKFIKNKLDLSIFKVFLDKLSYMSDESIEVIDTLNYLSKKYELVVLTNWFTDVQVKRLKKANILNFFKEVYGGEVYMKPNKKAFLMACSKYKPSECLMIGDNYQKDILGAKNANLNVIYFNFKNKENIDNFTEIKKFSELKEVL